MNINCVLRLTGIIHLTVLAASAQLSLVGLQGSVIDDGGNLLPSVQVLYRRIPKQSGPPGRLVLAPGETFASGALTSDLNGVFSLSSANSGNYVICAVSSAGPYLDPCKWQSAVRVTIGAGAVANPLIQMKKGVFLNVQINDPSAALLPLKTSGFQPANLLVGVKFGNGAFLGAETITANSSGRLFQMPVPAGVPLKLWIYSRTLTIKDASGSALPLLGAAVPFQAVPGQDQSFVYSVTNATSASSAH